MVAFWRVLDHWTDPNGIKAHALNVIKMVLNTLPGASTVVAQVGALS